MARVRASLEGPNWIEFWQALAIPLLSFNDAGLNDEMPDNELWRLCQKSEWILITGNRNQHGPTSLEETIRNENTPMSLPVITIGSPRLLMNSAEYVERVSGKLLEFLEDIANLRGSGRQYVP